MVDFSRSYSKKLEESVFWDTW